METILSIDLGKNKSVACIFDKKSFNAKFKTIKTTAAVLRELVDKVKPDIVLFEVGSSAGWIADMLNDMSVPFKVANTNHPAWKWRNNSKKTDRDDAYRMVTMYLNNSLPTVYIPNKEVRQKRSLVNYRQSLVGRITQSKNTIRSILSSVDISMPSGKKGWSQKSLEELKKIAINIQEIGSDEDFWQGELYAELEVLEKLCEQLKNITAKLNSLAEKDENIQLIKTIPGVGNRVAEAVVAILDDPHRFKSAKQVGSYAGLVPRCYQSGQMEKNGRITRQGDSLIRALLVQVSWLGLRYEWMREIFDRVQKGSKSRNKIAIVALARHILVRCWAMLRDGSKWHGSVAMVKK
ncbi:MAG TPA: IS110 family transposase [Paludibacter sp.]|jgi:transposase|nr:IS110 family transposase [Paludibacter sp.]